MPAEPLDRDEASHPFIATAPARAALPLLLHGFGARAPFVLLTGDAGTGRSWLAAEWIERLGERTTPAVLPEPAPLATDIASALVPQFDGRDDAHTSTAAATEALLQVLANATAAGRVAVIVADDADRLDDAQLLELRRIADAAALRQCPLEVLLVGTPAFAVRLESPAMRELRARLALHIPLARFSPNDTREYLQSRLTPSGVPCMGLFSRKASRDIHQESLGLVGLVESVASESLRRAGREGSASVSPEHVRAAARAVRSGRLSEDVHEPTLSQVRPRAARPIKAAAADAPVPPAPVPPPVAPALNAMPDAANGTTGPNTHSKRHKRGKHRAQTSANNANAAPARPSAAAPTPATPPSPAPVAPAAPKPVPAPVARLKSPTPPPGALPRVMPLPPTPSRPTPMPAGPMPTGDEGTEAMRVQAWLARFGGAGSARVGAPQRGASLDEASLLAELNAIEAGEAAAGDETWPPKQHTRGAPVLRPRPLRRHANAFALPLVLLAALAGVLLLVFAQRQTIGRMVSAALAEARPEPTYKPVARVVPPTPAPPPAPRDQFSIAAGRFGTRELALAEADYLGRLITPRVRVGGLARGAARLLIGRFDSRAEALRALKGLENRGLIRDAKVIEVPPLAGDNESATAADTTATSR